MMRAIAKTHTGRLRKVNEDCVHVDPDLGLLIVADGMGGHSGGEVASRLAVETLSSLLKPALAAGLIRLEETLRVSFAQADQAVLAKAAEDPTLNGMGTTLVVSICEAATLCVAHVGDSRAYLLREGILRQLTQDHSLVAHLIRNGELSPNQAQEYPMRNVLVRSIGNCNTPLADIQTLAWASGDCLMLCSDGLTNMVADDDIQKVLASSRVCMEDKCQQLVSLANRRGGKDNISVILASHD